MCADNCQIANLLATADYIDHGRPSEEDVHGALNRLVAARLIRVRKAGISVTERARELYAKAVDHSGNAVRAQVDALRRLLACPHCGVELGAVRWRRYTASSDFAAAG